MMEKRPSEDALRAQAETTVYSVLFALSFAHLLNDALQSLIPAIYPLLRRSFSLNYTQIGLITLTYQLAASLLQPLVGMITDRKPKPMSLVMGMVFVLGGLVCLSLADSFHMILISVALVGIGSSVFHPEASRVVHMAAGYRRGMAQSLFQVGGNMGSSFGPLLAALIIVPYGQFYIIWFSLAALFAMGVMTWIGKWYRQNIFSIQNKKKLSHAVSEGYLPFSKGKVAFSITILLVLTFSKLFYMAAINSFYTFYLINKFGVSISDSQIYLFVFLFSVAAGTYIGGPLSDKIGRKYVIWISILGVSPFTMLLPYVSLFWTIILSIFIGFILASAFSVILVYAQELLPEKIGMVSGLFFGFAFGIGGLGAAILGKIADAKSVQYVYQLCAYLPFIGLITIFLPNLKKKKRQI